MNIKKLTLENFGNIDNSTLDLNSEINLIIGNNGEGKSTVLKAISLHLFNFSKGNLEDYIKWGANNFKTSIEFSHNGRQFKQTIYYDLKKKSERELWVDNDYYKNSDAVKKLADYFDPKIALASTISFEGEVDLINVKPSERREHLKRIYNLDFKDGVEDLDLQIKKIENDDIINIDKKLYAINNKSYHEKQEEKLLISKEEKELKEKELNNLNLIKSNFELRLKEYENNIKQYNQMKEIVSKAETEIVESKLKVIKLENDHKNNVEWADKNKTNIKDNLIQQERLNINEDELNKIIEEKNSIRLMRVKVFDESLLDENKNKKGLLIGNINTLRDQIKLCESGNCPTCGQKFDLNKVEQYKNQLSDSESILFEINKIIDTLENDKKENQRQAEEQNELKLKLEILKQKEEQEKQRIENEKRTIENKILSLKKELEDADSLYNEKQSNIDYLLVGLKDSINKNIIILEKCKLQLKEMSSSISFSLEKPKVDDDLEIKINLLLSEIKLYEKTIIINEEIKKFNKQLNIEKEQDKIENLKLQKEKDKLIEEIEIMKKGKVILQKEFPNYVISSMVKMLEDGLNNFIDKTYNGKYQLKIEDEKNNINIVYGPNKKDCSLSSGYERQLFSLAWKHALSKLQNLSILILDEIDSQSSIENSQILFNVIGEMKNLYQQIIIITHKPETQELLQNNYNAKIFEARNGTIYNIN